MDAKNFVESLSDIIVYYSPEFLQTSIRKGDLETTKYIVEELCNGSTYAYALKSAIETGQKEIALYLVEESPMSNRLEKEASTIISYIGLGAYRNPTF